MNLSPWSLNLKIIAAAFHSTAIACTAFRLMYRCHMARFSWEDGWAALAFVLDILCLVSVWLQAPSTANGLPPIDKITNGIVLMAFPTVLWICRMSILFSIVRVANPSQQPRRVVHLAICSFVIMWAALIAQRIQICVTHNCKITGSVGIAQLITDVVSDFVLVAMPIRLLRRTKLTRRQRILIYSVFSATSLITVVTILHSVAILTVTTSPDGIVIIGHVKTALSLIVCNLLVIVTFVYRIIGGDKSFDLDVPDQIPEFTTVDLGTGMGDISEAAEGKYTARTFSTQTGSAVTRSVPFSSEMSFSTTPSRSVGVEEKIEGSSGHDLAQ